MSLLQKLAASIQENVQRYEAAIAKSGLKQPHLWEAKPYELDDPEVLADMEVYEYFNKIRADTRAIETIITPSRYKLLELSLGAIKGATLSTAASLGVSDAIEKQGGSARLDQLAQGLSVNENKLGRLLRLLTGEYIFAETSLDTFENTRHSTSLLKRNGAEHFISLTAEQNAISATGLYKDMTDPGTKDSCDPAKSTFSSTFLHRDQSFMDYLMSPEGAELAAKVMAGVVPWLNRVTRGGLLHDYPWQDLSNVTVVDVGAAPGDSGYDVLRMNHNIKWIFQDLPEGIEMMKQSIPEDMKERVQKGQISFTVQDWSKRNQSRGEVWYIRGVLRELDDDSALELLKHVAEAMRATPGARLVINEAICTSPVFRPSALGADAVPSTSIPPHQTPFSEMGNLMSTSAVLFFAGKERSYEEYEALLDKAGLEISKLFVLRTLTAMPECVLKSASTIPASSADRGPRTPGVEAS